MIIFTKDVFLNLKHCTAIYVQSVQNVDYVENKPVSRDNWQVVITGHLENNNSVNAFDLFTCNVQCASRDEAYETYQEVMKQVVDSGTHPDLNTQLIDKILKEK